MKNLIFTIAKIIIAAAVVIAIMNWLGITWNDIENLFGHAMNSVGNTLKQLKGMANW